MTIEEIKQYIEQELSKGNTKPYKKLRTYLNLIYRRLNKDKVKGYNNTYYKKCKEFKKHTELIKKHTETEKEIKGYSYKKSEGLDIF